MMRVGLSVLTALGAICVSGQAYAASSISFDIDKTHPYTATITGGGLLFEVQSYVTALNGSTNQPVMFDAGFYGFFNGRSCGNLPRDTPECVNPSYMSFGTNATAAGNNELVSSRAVIPTFGSSTFYKLTISTTSDDILRFTDLTFASASYSFADLQQGQISGPAQLLPEPGTWLMMLTGFGLVGLAVRKRSSVKTTIVYA